jgi:hypothetical protein
MKPERVARADEPTPHLPTQAPPGADCKVFPRNQSPEKQNGHQKVPGA